VLVGEDGGRKIAGFDLGNSPAEVERADLAGRDVVLRSTSGVQAVVRAAHADAVCLASLVTASASARWLAAGGVVTLLAAGSPGEDDAAEDEACADLVEDLLRGRPADPAAAVRRVRASRAGLRARDPAVDWITPEDLERAVAVDRFGFCLPVRREDGLLVARPEEPDAGPGGAGP
jgi:2-phosphosulfolactate phosphatase